MSVPSTYQIVVRGRPSERLLRPFVDEFRITPGDGDTTILTGPVGDSSQLMGLLNHLASVRIDIVSFGPFPDPPGEHVDT